MALDIPLRKTNTGQQTLSFVQTKIWTKLGDSTKKVKTIASFTPCWEEINSKQTL